MINSKMRTYDYYHLGDDNGYGQATLIRDDEGKPVKQGEVILSISTVTQAIADDIRYSDSSYIGLTFNKDINDTYIIQHEQELLKVLYVNTDGRYTQVFMSVYE